MAAGHRAVDRQHRGSVQILGTTERGLSPDTARGSRTTQHSFFVCPEIQLVQHPSIWSAMASRVSSVSPGHASMIASSRGSRTAPPGAPAGESLARNSQRVKQLPFSVRFPSTPASYFFRLPVNAAEARLKNGALRRTASESRWFANVMQGIKRRQFRTS